MPTTRTPACASLAATPRVSSPPHATTASSWSFLMFSSTSSDRSTISPDSVNCLKGFVREEPRLVPPSRSHLRTVSRTRGSTSGSGFNKLRQPSNKPTTSSPSSEPRYTKPLIAGFNPGASPPPVSTPTRIALAINQNIICNFRRKSLKYLSPYLDVIKSLLELIAKREVYLFSLAVGEDSEVAP